MKVTKSPHSEGRHRAAGGLLLLCLATACGDQKAAGDASGSDAGSGAHAGGGAPSGGAMSGGAPSGGLGGGGRGAAGAGDAGAGAAGSAAGMPGKAGASASGGAAGSPNGGANQGGAPGATLAAVQAIFDDRCVNCHDAGKFGVPTYPMLPLTAGASHAALVNVAADETCGGVRVVPGNPDASYLVKKLEQMTPCDGAHMPRPFEVGTAPPLTADQLATIRAWISAGAPE